MPSTSGGLELYRALSRDDMTLTHRIFATAMLSLTSGNAARVSVQTTDGQYHYLEISTRISTDTANESGGPQRD
jgi:hypothetical protein